MARKVSKKQRKKAIEPPVAAPVPIAEWRFVSWLRSHSRAAFLALVAIATMRIVATYPIFDHTADEVGHVAVGMEFWDKGVYHMEWQHPPLARAAVGLGPYLAGARSHGIAARVFEGAAVLNSGGHYERNLALARLGIIPFFWIAALVVYLWARRAAGDLAAVLAVFLFTFLPPVLAHAGVATTDMALTAFLGASFLTALVWLEEPTPAHTAWFGASVGLAVLSKFSALPFLPATMAAALAWYLAVERPGMAKLRAIVQARLPLFGLAVLVGALVIWAGYRFSFGPIPKSGSHLSLPAPELFAGIQEVAAHNEVGHPAYLLGNHSTFGWWYYYPIVLAVKTPLPFLALMFFGASLVWRKSEARGLWLPLTFSLGILLFSLVSRINIGVRHVLPVYIGFSVVAAAGAAKLLEMADVSGRARWALALLLLWLAATSLLSHPDYLADFNALAGHNPERIIVDSDLDWGQDMKRLGRRLHELDAHEVTFVPLVPTAARGYPPIHAGFREIPSPGWNAVSITQWKSERFGLVDEHPELRLWPDRYQPVERIGKGILLYYFPP